MTMAICFKCGSAKSGALVACRSCNAAPRANSEYAVSLALSDHVSSKDQLAQYSHELRNGKKLSVPREALVQALDALKDPQLLAMLGAQPQPADPAQAPAAVRQHPPIPPAAQQRVAPPPPPVKPEPRLTTTALHQSAFAVLGVTTRDDRRRIVELAEEKSLELDHDVCQKARSDLTNPRTRLGVEIAWLPGVSPRKATQLVGGLLNDPMTIREESGLPTLAHLNLLAAAFEAVDGKHDADDLAEFIVETAYLAEELTPEEVLRDINEDRVASRFPEVNSLDQIEAELTERKRYYRTAIKDALDRLPPMTLIQVMTETVDGVTAGGEDHAPGLIDDLVDSYEVETQGVLHKEAENVHKLIKAARDHAGSGESAVKPYVDKLDAVARNWDKIAQPIQLSSKARGIDHKASRDLAYEIRSLAIDLFNEHDMLKEAQRLTSLVQEIFAEVPDVSEKVGEDAEALADIRQRRNESAAIEPIQNLVAEVLKSIDRCPSTANNDGERLLTEGMSLLRAAQIKTNSPTYREAQNILAAGIMQCAIAFGNQTSKWVPCISLLQKALEIASDTELRKKLNENLIVVRENHDSLGDLEPIKKAPSLRTINGIGTTIYGGTDPKPDGSRMATYYFVFFGIPIFPIARYRVISTGVGYRFLGKGPLRPFDYLHIAISIGLILFMFSNG